MLMLNKIQNCWAVQRTRNLMNQNCWVDLKMLTPTQTTDSRPQTVKKKAELRQRLAWLNPQTQTLSKPIKKLLLETKPGNRPHSRRDTNNQAMLIGECD